MTVGLSEAGLSSGDEGRSVDELIFPVRGMNCQSCVRHVEDAIRGVRGVESAKVDLTARQATVKFDGSLVTFDVLQSAVEAAGYVAVDPTPVGLGAAREDRVVSNSALPSYISTGSAVAGLLASVLLVGFYLVVMTVAQGFDAAIGLLEEDWYLITPLLIGFGVQIGLFVRMRQLHADTNRRPANAVAGASGGISGLSMLACCTHHLADLLPFLGLTGLAMFLGEYRQVIMLFGIASNLAGVVFMLRNLKRCRELA